MSPGPSASARGAWAERAAREHLERHGLECVASNYRCRSGEIDLVMREGETLIFVEVRYRRSARFGTGAESVDARKRARIARAARYFLQREVARTDPPCRFDVVSVTGGGAGDDLEWVRDAFEA